MHPIDTKRLIAGFLLLTTVVTASVALLSAGLLSRPSEPVAERAPGSASAPAPTRAFVERPEPADVSARTSTGTDAFADVDRAALTLTDELLLALGEELVAANPNGPSITDGIAGTDVADVVDRVLSTERAQVAIPDWEAEANRQTIAVLTEFTTEDTNRYYQELNELLAGSYSPPAGSSAIDLGDEPYAAMHFSDMHARGLRIVVPEPLAGFHWSLMKLLAYEAKAQELAELANTDPVRAAAIAEVQEKNYFAAVELLTREAQRRTDIRGIWMEETPQLLAFLHGVLGVKTAHAYVWITFNPMEIARAIWKWAKMIITEKLKDLLVHRLVQQTIPRVQGGGKTPLVTEW